MPVLPSGLALPPVPYVVGVLVAVVLVAALLWTLEPVVDQRVVLALAPWMALGGTAHALYQLPDDVFAYPAVLDPLFGAPAVYLTTFVLAGLTWAVLGLAGVVRGHQGTVPRNLGLAGTVALAAAFGLAIGEAVVAGTLAPVWPAVSVVVAAGLTGLIALGVGLWRTALSYRIRYAAPTVVFAHALDGVSTAVGADVLDATERSPLPKAIMEFAGGLPTAEVLGVGWLFVFVKLVVATVIAVGAHDYLEADPTEAALLLSVVAAVGLGPATNNLVLFLVGAS